MVPPDAPVGPEALVLGAGPAGTAAAKVLAAAGRRVLLLHRDSGRSGMPEETLVPGAAALIARLGLGAVFAREEFRGTARHGIRWGADRLVWREQGPDSRGWKVNREHLDELLRSDAGNSGAEIVPVIDARILPDLRSVRAVLSGGVERTWRPSAIIVATGRNAGPSVVPGSVTGSRPSSVALWCPLDAGQELAEATILEAVSEGWWWWLPGSGAPPGEGWLALIADAGEVRRLGRDEVWRAARGGAMGPARKAPDRPTCGTTATPRRFRSPGRLLLAGDAASTLDPLSSQGLEKALASGEHAALTVTTCLELPDAAEELVRNHDAWEEEHFRIHTLRTGQLHSMVPDHAAAAYWSARRIESPPTPNPFDPAARLQPGSTVQPARVWRPGRGRLVPQPGYRPGPGRLPRATLNGVALSALLRLAGGTASGSQLLEKARQDPELLLSSPASLGSALTEAIQLGFLDIVQI